MVNVTLAVCDKGIAEQTDIVQGFLQMLAQVVKKNPLFLLHPDFHLAALFQCGTFVIVNNCWKMEFTSSNNS